MHEKSLVEIVEEALDQEDIELPVFDQVALKLQQLLAKDDYSLAEVAKIIQKDQALASQVLKVANSAFYAGLRPVKTIREAAVRLGSKSIVNLVVMVTQKPLYESRHSEYAPWMKLLWSHALGTATASRWLALHTGFHQVAEESFLAGLLHDIGKLVLLKIMEDLQHAGPSKRDIPTSLIADVLETMHAEQGQRLMRRQNMPEVYCEVVGQHHEPEVGADHIVLNVVRLGNYACHKLGLGPKHDPELMLSTTPEAANLMAKDLLLAELQVKLEEYVASVKKFL